MKKAFISWNPNKKTLALLTQVEEVLDDLAAQGYTLTLRQLHYQLVSRGITPNTQADYSKLGDILTNARLAGFIDWKHLHDRHRHADSPVTWKTPGQIIKAAAQQYKIDLWVGQDYRPEVWVEKDALSGVIAPICSDERVTFMACKGYLSTSAKWDARARFEDTMYRWRQKPVVVYLGDHDPSGLDMPRNIQDDLDVLMEERGAVEVVRIALTKEQISQFNPPPNPAKQTDSRWAEYAYEHGNESWELDALHPNFLASLVRETIRSYRSKKETWQAMVQKEESQKAKLLGLSDDFDNIGKE